MYIGIRTDLSSEIISLFSVHRFSIICSVVSIKLRMSGNEWPCIMIVMSSAKTTILVFASRESMLISSPVMMFHEVGPETKPWGQPLVTCFVLRELPNLKWAMWSRKKSSTILYMFRGQLSFLRRARIPGCQALSKVPTMSRARRQHLSPCFLLVPAKSMTVSI